MEANDTLCPICNSKYENHCSKCGYIKDEINKDWISFNTDKGIIHIYKSAHKFKNINYVF